MSVAIVQGSSGGLGAALAKHLLTNTSLKVYALTHRSSSKELKEQLGGASDRLTVLEGIDVKEEESLHKAAEAVKGREGKGSVRLVACLAGVLSPEKSLAAVDAKTVLDQFGINTLGHLLTYKHFVPLIPTRKEFKELHDKWGGSEDPAKGLVSADHSLCWSLSARIGSITDNQKGGWYSYRATKAALNQVIRTLDHELANKSSSALAVAYHPGTVLTDFSKPIVGHDTTPKPNEGVFAPEQAVEHMVKVMGKASREGGGEWGGRFFDWRGERVQW